jgi:hypothetical protein
LDLEVKQGFTYAHFMLVALKMPAVSPAEQEKLRAFLKARLGKDSIRLVISR